MGLGRLALPSASWFQHVTALLTGKWGSRFFFKDLGFNVPTKALP